ncbi:cytochrome c biogenesis protein CcdA [Blastococcus brunescens]|uniref:Cytochrome c biogenesis protein CcdA n=1 Tax=Blastococcus brunescens TaxID=1564165 RepID=A0ABZ1B6A7_9ACTN|nr:cytochrome c biogenesis protein CcdA [Blastococcus sp. BMG 8361]WRL65661.1 cytochrome c biogenesis protein CcdA [Blastococcus sp. BMG 8361]
MSELGATFAGIVTDGSLLVAIAVAALVGLISFASPCCLPLIPGYVSYVAGLAGSQATAGRPRAPQPAGGGPAGATSAGCASEAGTAPHRRRPR